MLVFQQLLTLTFLYNVMLFPVYGKAMLCEYCAYISPVMCLRAHEIGGEPIALSRVQINTPVTCYIIATLRDPGIEHVLRKALRTESFIRTCILFPVLV